VLPVVEYEGGREGKERKGKERTSCIPENRRISLSLVLSLLCYLIHHARMRNRSKIRTIGLLLQTYLLQTYFVLVAFYFCLVITMHECFLHKGSCIQMT
jgi:hypothetical protein